MNKPYIQAFREKWEGANTSDHTSLTSRIMDDMCEDLEDILDRNTDETKAGIIKDIIVNVILDETNGLSNYQANDLVNKIKELKGNTKL